jgi:hypothetical protein
VAAALGPACRIDMTSHGATFLARICGLVIHADTPLPGFRPLDSAETPDIRIRLQGSTGAPAVNEDDTAWYVSPYRDDRDVPLLTIRTVGSGYLLCYAEGARFLVSASGSEIDAWWDAPLTEVDAADYLLGGVVAFIVRVRGMVPLHASAVVVQGHAVLFAGGQGAGKSSIAAAFAVLGYPVLSDDIVVLDEAVGSVRAYPSHPHLSLWADSARSLFSSSLPAHSSVYDKQRLDLLEHGYRFHEHPVPIGMICILAAREASSRLPTIHALRPQTAMMQLVSHTYGNYLLDASMRGREFDVLGRVASSVCVSELSFGADLDALVSGCRLVADDLALQSAAQTT